MSDPEPVASSGPQSGAGESTAPGASPDAPDRVLLVIIASDPAMLDDVITTLLDIGVTGATVVESRGLGAILREEMPIFAGLASMLPEQTGSRVVLSLTTQPMADRLFQVIEEELKSGARPIALACPVVRVAGLSR